MADKLLHKGKIAFQAEGRLLQELGLRLVASPEVALVELIKNAFDADSPSCFVRVEDSGATLVVEDKGHGMTLDDFSTKWMRIATSSKLSQNFSRKYHRPLTGAKGIGRFAVRYLGDHLTLQSITYDRERKSTTKLTATFDWRKLDTVATLSQVEVPYTLVEVPSESQHGTTLTIKQLRAGASFVDSRELRDNVLRMVSPLKGLSSGRFSPTAAEGEEDPGFNVVLPGETEDQSLNLATLLLDRYWARLTISLKGRRLRFRVYHANRKEPRELTVKVSSSISKGFFADIRYFPRRKGMFSGVGVNGRKAWTWVRENHGVAVVDHGFRIKPYGFKNDDWLRLDRDAAHNIRDWTTEIAKEHFPVLAAKKGEPAENPVLYLPSNFQLIGAVFIETKRKPSADEDEDLTPAMDREGLLANSGARELRRFVRAGIEFLANEDKAELERLAAIEAREVAKTARKEIRDAIKHIEQSPTLLPKDKSRIVKQYLHLADRLEEQEEYSAHARRSLTTMSLLGVVAGFMTHESKAAVHDLEAAVAIVRRLARKTPELSEIADDLGGRLSNFQGYLNYARMFVRSVRESKEQELPAAGQIRHVLNSFKTFADDRGIEVVNEVKPDVITPPLPVTVYSGVLLNLYTNALKAVIAAQSSVDEPRICFRAWNEPKRHVVEVADNGVGVPPELRKRIFDPLYTTTSDTGNPLGSGMGLGLTLVKQVTSEFGGSVMIVDDPPPGYNTCIRVQFPRDGARR
jgi:signal transduction histidine kinase